MRDGTTTRREFRDSAARLRIVIEGLIEEGTATPGIAGSCKDILAHRAAMWRFVDDARVDPTNNRAERELRGFVLWRKAATAAVVSAATRSPPTLSSATKN